MLSLFGLGLIKLHDLFIQILVASNRSALLNNLQQRLENQKLDTYLI